MILIFLKNHAKRVGLKVTDKSTDKTYFFYGSELKSNEGDYVSGYISTGDLDLVKDVVTPECMADMIEQMKDRSIKIDVEHEAFRGNNKVEKEINKTIIPIGKIESAVMESKGIKVKTKLNRFNKRYDEVKGSIKDKFLDAFSIAYIPEKVSTEIKNGEKVRRLEKITLLNVAYTGNPVNTEAQFTDIMLKSMNDSFGGILMAEEEKPVEPVPEKEEAPKETPVEPKESEEVKALKEENAELKAKLKAEEEEKPKEPVPEEEPSKVEERLAGLEAKSKEYEAQFKALKKPVVKGIVEKESADVTETKSVGPLDDL